jgi:hypothetical protein
MSASNGRRGASRAPHPATVQRARPPHAATVQRARPPHAATVVSERPAHPAVGGRVGATVQRSQWMASASGSGEKGGSGDDKRGDKGGGGGGGRGHKPIDSVDYLFRLMMSVRSRWAVTGSWALVLWDMCLAGRMRQQRLAANLHPGDVDLLVPAGEYGQRSPLERLVAELRMRAPQQDRPPKLNAVQESVDFAHFSVDVLASGDFGDIDQITFLRLQGLGAVPVSTLESLAKQQRTILGMFGLTDELRAKAQQRLQWIAALQQRARVLEVVAVQQALARARARQLAAGHVTVIEDTFEDTR